jgi:glycine cleavage system H lipoate-binding protein
MFPGVDGFHWSIGHIFFISVFLCIAAALAVVAIVSAARTVRNLRGGHAESIRWSAAFTELPLRDRKCRHALTGEVAGRICPNAFQCGSCRDHSRFRQARRGETADVLFGLSYPNHRYYHRGHTWVEEQADGTLLVGLDTLGRMAIGRPDSVTMPGTGSALRINGEGWRIRKDGLEVRVLSPVDGVVLQTGVEDDSWLKVKPSSNPPDLRHLLRGDEVRAWVGQELERLQLSATGDETPLLADGGILMDQFLHEFPVARRDEVLGELFLEP